MVINKKLVLFLVLVSFLVLGIIFAYTKTNNQSTVTYNSQKTIKSSNFKTIEHTTVNDKFSIEVPSNYRVEKDLTYLKLVNNNDKEIVITWIASDFDNLTDHLDRLGKLNKIPIELDGNIIVDGDIEKVYSHVYEEGTTHLKLKERTYSIYKQGWVYSITASNESLYGDLNMIATSFQFLSE